MMKKVFIAILVVIAMAASVYAGAIAKGTVAAINGNNVTFDFTEHDMTAGDKIQMGFGAVGTVTAAEGNSVTVEFTKSYRELDKKLKNKGRVQAENGGKDGKFTPGLKGC